MGCLCLSDLHLAGERGVRRREGQVREEGFLEGSDGIKNLPAMQETRVWCLAQEDPLEKGVAFCSVPWRHRGQGLFSIVFLASAFRWLLSPLHLYFSSLAACRWPFQAQSSLFLQEIPFNSSGYCLLWVPEHLLAPRTWIISPLYWWYRTSLVAQMLKNLWAMQETWFWSLGGEDPLEKGMATHSSTLAWEIPWTEEPCGLQSMGSQRVGHN